MISGRALQMLREASSDITLFERVRVSHAVEREVERICDLVETQHLRELHRANPISWADPDSDEYHQGL